MGWLYRCAAVLLYRDPRSMPPIGTDAYPTDNAMEIVKNGGAEQLARMLPRMPDKLSANLIATGSMVQRTAYIERVMDPELSFQHAKRQTAAR